MNTAVYEARQRTKQGRVRTVLRVAEGDRYVGDILLDPKGRVWRHADTIPTDVVFKAMLTHNRQGEVRGRLVGLRDGRTYSWVVVGALELIDAA